MVPVRDPAGWIDIRQLSTSSAASGAMVASHASRTSRCPVYRNGAAESRNRNLVEPYGTSDDGAHPFPPHSLYRARIVVLTNVPLLTVDTLGRVGGRAATRVFALSTGYGGGDFVVRRLLLALGAHFIFIKRKEER